MKNEKIINEIAEIIHSGCDGTYCRDCKFFTKELKESGKCIAMFTAERLYNADCQTAIQGEWIYHESVVTDDGLISGYSCSLCDAFVYEDEFNTDEFHKKYCGNCGAKMENGG